MANNTDWLNISQMTGGTGETALSLTALTNTSLEPKTATITARNTQYNVSDTTTVTIQGFQPTLTLSRSTLRFDSTGGTATFTVYSNTAWTINFPAIVQSYSTSAGTGNTEVSVVLAPNPDEVAKVDTGIVKDVYNVNQLFLTIVQESFIVELYVEPTDDIVFANTGSSTSITIDSNADWELEYPSWVTPSITSGESGSTIVILTAGQNGPNDRSGEITVYAGSKSVTINVSQPFYIVPYLAINPSALTFSYNADVSTVIVNSYPGWSAEVFSSGETHWGEDIALTVTLEVGIDNVTVSDLGQTGCIVNGVVVPGSTYTFKTIGTYTVLYPFTGETLSGMGTIPDYDSITATSIVIGENITTIPTNCFYGEKITAITIPSGITSIGGGAFTCPNLTTIYAEPVVAPSVTNTTFKDIAKNGTLHYPAGSNYSTWLSTDEYYLGYNFWNGLMPSGLEWLYTVTYDVTSTTADTKILGTSYYIAGIRDRATDQVIYDNNTTYMFSQTGKQDLDFLVWSAQTRAVFDLRGSEATDLVVKGQGEKVCKVITNGNKLTGLTISGGAINCFYGSGNGTYYAITPSVKKLVYGANVTKLNEGRNNLSGCSWLHYVDMSQTSIVLPEKVFDNCTGLTTVLLPNNITEIPAYAFRDCKSLINVTLPEGITTIWNDAFAGCTALETVTIPSTVTDMSKSAFSNYFQVFGNNTSLKTIFAFSLVPPKTSGTTFGEGIATGGTFYCPPGTSSRYRNNSQFNALFSNSSWTVSEMSAEDYGIRCSKKTITAPPSGNVETLTISSLYPWVASANRNWVSLSQTTGESGRSAITVTVDSSVVPIEREATITIDNGQATFVVTVEQTLCKPKVIKYYTGNKNNAGEGPSYGYLFDSGVTVVNNCDYDFTGIKSIYRGIYSGVSGEAVPEGPIAVFGSASAYTNCGMTGCLKTLTEVEVDIPDVTYIAWPFGNYNQACQTLTSVTFTSTDKVYTFRGAFNGLTNLKRVKLGNLSNAKFELSTYYESDRIFGGCSALTDLEIEALPDINLTTLWSFAVAPALTQQSLLNILNALPVTTNNRELRLGSTNIAKLSAEQLAIGTNKGWTID